MTEQIYEEYWKFTSAFTDYNGEKFLITLKTVINHIDNNDYTTFSPEKYSLLQADLVANLKIDVASVRKAINQLVKMGFINFELKSYHINAKEYLEANTNRKRESILSKIVYSNSSLNRSVTNESKLHEINFLINTLIELGKLTEEDIAALMLIDISNIHKGYVNREELDISLQRLQQIDFADRKYNQISYLTNLLSKLDGIIFVNKELYFIEDAKQIFGSELSETTRKRNPYLHLIYKNQLKQESLSIFGKEKCMVEELAYPILIASHIKPFIDSNEDEGYNPDNGILLSQNVDGLFDKKLISFNDDGSIIISENLDKELKDELRNYKLNYNFLTKERLYFLNIHRSLFQNKENQFSQ